jgi:hypothetical protein
MQKTGDAQTIGDASRRLREDLGDLFTAFTRSKEDLSGRLGGFLHERPIASVAIAFGIGYVLAGGVFSRATSRLLAIGARIYGLKLARNLMGDAIDAQPGRP